MNREHHDPAPASLRRLAPGLAVEHFDDESVVFLPGEDLWMTTNRSGGEVVDLLVQRFGPSAFSAAELAELLARHYDLEGPEAETEARELFASWTEQRILRLANPLADEEVPGGGEGR